MLTAGEAVIECDICDDIDTFPDADVDLEAADDTENRGLGVTVFDVRTLVETDGERDATEETEVEGLCERDERGDPLTFGD